MDRRNRGGWGHRGSLLGLSLALGVLTLTAVAYAVDLLTVTQRETWIRKDKKPIGTPKLAAVKEGDQLTKLGEEGDWYQVEFKGTQGWIQKTAVSGDRSVVLSSSAEATQVRASEQSAGGRGFNEQVEAQYRASRSDLNAAYKLLDKIQNRKFAEDSVARFLQDGKLGDQVAEAPPSPARPAASRAVSSKEGRATPPWKQ